MHESEITYYYLMQPKKLIQTQRYTSRLADGLTPPLDTALWRLFPLYRKTGPGIIHKQERGCSGQNILGDISYYFLCLALIALSVRGTGTLRSKV
ncbi:MAG: hypothetical protein K8S15_02410 [Candidatus Aegiribacteria sp.]|nr:hypothetical protein [Candidatus Aegiribacteria sp.]